MTSISQLTRILSSATASLAFVFVYPAADLTGISLQFTNTKQTLRFVAFLEVLSTIQSHPTCTKRTMLDFTWFCAFQTFSDDQNDRCLFYSLLCKNTPYETFNEVTRIHIYQRMYKS